MAAALGGTQSLHTNAFDETLALPTEESVRIALRTQQVLAYETGIANVADPLGGSYYVEALTDAMEREAEGLFAEIEAQGGVVPAIESGWFQRQIAHSSMRFQSEVEQHRRVKAGDGYHTDTSWRLVPTWGAVLRAVNLPPVGGDTVWVDANLAYEGLPPEVKERLEGLHVTHDFREALLAGGNDYPVVAHPVVRTHRETGQKILWVNLTQKPQILGVELAESRELLDEVLRQYKRPEFQVRFSWKPNSVAFWDNRAAVHYAVRNYGDFPRLLERILIADEPLYADL